MNDLATLTSRLPGSCLSQAEDHNMNVLGLVFHLLECIQALLEAGRPPIQ